MTKEEIKAAIAANLAGQGSMIDISGQLPAILDAIVDAIPTLPEPYELPVASADVLGGIKVSTGLAISQDGRLITKEEGYEVLNPPQDFEDKTAAEVAELGIDGLDTELKVNDFYEKAMIGYYKRFSIKNYALIWGGSAVPSSTSTLCSFICVGGLGDAGAITAVLYLKRSGIPAKYSWFWIEI